MKTRSTVAALLILLVIHGFAAEPKLGDSAPNFELKTLGGARVELKQLLTDKSVVLVVLRGWPGYQCPICTRQVQEFVKHADEFEKAGARVLMVYPGPNENLKAHAQEFLRDKNWPKEFLFVTDPDYKFTERYGLRWNAKNETAYPSTFVIDEAGKITFTHVSKTHDNRASAAPVLEKLKAQKEKVGG
jgi:thioredoxin-dependent peroxiredoxin